MQTSLLPLISGCLGSTFAATFGTIIAARASWGYQPSGSWSTIYLASEAIHIVVRGVIRPPASATSGWCGLTPLSMTATDAPAQ